jgi:uncharacterized membrane protein YheB (UPF0754 family)
MNQRYDTILLISIPLISALIGYVTNYIAVLMLFRPHRPRGFLGLRIQGLVPRRQKEIARSLGAMIERDLFSHADIQAALSSVDTANEAELFLNEQIDLFIQGLVAKNPMIAMFAQGPIIDQMKGVLRAQLAERFPAFVERVVQKAEGKLDVSEIVRAKVEAFDLSKLEAVIHEVSARELKTIEILGGVLGFIIGLAQLGLMLL